VVAPRTAAARSALAQSLPSRRSLAVGLGLLALVGAGYAALRASSAFAVRTVELHGASPRAAEAIRAALRPVEGRSLLALGGDEVDRRVAALPEVVAATHDRAFPNTLVVTVRLERALAVARSGARAWLVSERGRVVRPLPRGAAPRLPRIWLARAAPPPGRFLASPDAALALRALRAAGRTRLPGRVRSARAADGELGFRLASGLELRLGDEHELPLKLAVAEAIVRTLPRPSDGGPAYLDVGVPERPVAGSEP
jgi:cell division septal protein FtsQ